MFKDLSLSISITFLLVLSIFILNSVSRTLFPAYFVYIGLALVVFWFFSQVGFEIISLFSTHNSDFFHIPFGINAYHRACYPQYH